MLLFDENPAAQLVPATAEIIRLLRERRNEVHQFVVDEEAAFLALA